MRLFDAQEKHLNLLNFLLKSRVYCLFMAIAIQNMGFKQLIKTKKNYNKKLKKSAKKKYWKSDFEQKKKKKEFAETQIYMTPVLSLIFFLKKARNKYSKIWKIATIN